MSKYRSKKTEVNGIVFSSRLEATRYQQLLMLEKAGEISDLWLQPEFQIFMGRINPETGEKQRSRFYIGDFAYIDNMDKRLIVEDTKGMETAEFRLKWELVRSQYPEYTFRIITKDDV